MSRRAPRTPAPRRWTVTIPAWHPVKDNELITSRHWGKAYRLKQADKRMVWYSFRVLPTRVIPRAKGKRRVTLTIVLGKGQRGGDPSAYWKSLLDALVDCEMLTDDNRQGVELMPVAYERAEKPATRIVLEEI